MKSCIIAFAMYSQIPMPKVEWNEKNMKYVICYFPLIGVVIAALELLVFFICEQLQIGSLLRGILLTIVPIMITGGIHMDGFLDTVDARNSYADREKKLEILKDPHAGAFAIIKGIVYCLLQVGFFSEVTFSGLVFLSVVFVFSRALSGFALANFKGAKETGLLASFAGGADKKVVSFAMIGYGIVGLIGLFGLLFYSGMQMENLILIVGICISCLLTFAYYHFFSYREFHGITGDIAGYFLQLVELTTLITCVIIEKVGPWFF